MVELSTKSCAVRAATVNWPLPLSVSDEPPAKVTELPDRAIVPLGVAPPLIVTEPDEEPLMMTPEVGKVCAAVHVFAFPRLIPIVPVATIGFGEKVKVAFAGAMLVTVPEADEVWFVHRPVTALYVQTWPVVGVPV